MKATLRIRRFDPSESPEPRWQDYEVEWEKGKVVLYCLHDIQERQDGTLAYRYSCRGAICGSCAVRINGTAALACKTQVSTLDTSRPVVIEPLLNSDVVKDLVVDQGPFFRALGKAMPWLSEGGRGPQERFTLEERMSAAEVDQWMRSTDCIMCQSCFSDCPKQREDASFEGPASCLAMYKRIFHPQEPEAARRLGAAAGPGGVFDCDRHGNCVRVCPKDCRPMRAIMMLRRRAEKEGLKPSGNAP
jgi:succinate dehydrogenase / fumarate reductase iron-sulfur subunit